MDNLEDYQKANAIQWLRSLGITVDSSDLAVRDGLLVILNSFEGHDTQELESFLNMPG